MFQKTKIRRMVFLLLVFCLLAGSFPAKTQAAPANAGSRAEAIVKKNVKSGDSTKKKLKRLFTYIQKNYDYARAMGFKTYDGWEKDYALEMFTKKKGSCYHYAAAYAFLARKATGYQVRIGVGKTNGFSGNLQDHAWTEVKIGSKWYICDTNMDKYAAKSSGKYFLKKRNVLKKVYDNYKNAKYFKVG